MVLLPIFVNKVLLEHRHTHSFMYYLWLLLFENNRVEWLWQRPYGWQSLKYLLSDSSQLPAAGLDTSFQTHNPIPHRLALWDTLVFLSWAPWASVHLECRGGPSLRADGTQDRARSPSGSSSTARAPECPQQPRKTGRKPCSHSGHWAFSDFTGELLSAVHPPRGQSSSVFQ